MGNEASKDGSCFPSPQVYTSSTKVVFATPHSSVAVGDEQASVGVNGIDDMHRCGKDARS